MKHFYFALTALLLAFPSPSRAQSEEVSGFPTDSAGYARAEVGEFEIAWKTIGGLHVSISHASQPSRPVWETVPNEPFVQAGLVVTDFNEQAGSFTVVEDKKERCRDQTIERVRAGAGSVTFEGELTSSPVWFWQSRERIEYALTFAATSIPGQLGFEVTLYPTSEPSDGEGVWRAGLIAASEPDERIYGFGEQFSRFDLKGQKLPVLVQEQGHGRGIQPITWLMNTFGGGVAGSWHTTYAPIPHYITSNAKSLFLENYEYSLFDMSEADRIAIEVDAEQMRGRILSGRTPLELIETYTEYTGRMKALPDWVNDGAIVGLQGGSAAVRENLSRLEDRDVPIAAVWVQDWVGQRSTFFGQRLWWNWEIDRPSYPDFEQFRDEIASKGMRLLGYVNPYLSDPSDKDDVQTNLFEEAGRLGYLLKDSKTGQTKIIGNGGFDAAIVDLSDDDARSWFKNVLKTQLLDNGFSGWMADFGEATPFDTAPGSGESPHTFHHRYPEEWARLNLEVIEEAGLEDEVLFFNRTAYTRSPGLSQLMWAGDQMVTWDAHDGIKTALTALLSSGLSGFSQNHSDIGGCISFVKEPIALFKRSKELLVRWMEMNAFTAVFRNHEGTNPLTAGQQIYSDDDTMDYFARFAKIYKALAPYRRTLFEEAEERGYPVVRHPLLNHFDDDTVLDLDYQFMLGTEFMVAPVLDKGKDFLDVYLPRGQWVHLWTGQTYGSSDSGVWAQNIPAPMGYPAVFYKKGSAWGEKLVADLEAAGILDRDPGLSGQGLYWYGYENERQKYEPGVPNRFYDPQKPVVIFGHGQKYQSAVTRDVIFFRCAPEICGEGEVAYIHHDWLDAGYNVGVFDWTAFADEKTVNDAEAKLWSTNGPVGMRYRLPNGNYTEQGAPASGIIDEMTALYESALAGHKGGEIRLVGHSLGSQLVTGVAHAIHLDIEDGRISPTLMPRRLSYLDPVWTKGSKSYLDDQNGDGEPDWTGERTRWAVADMVDRWTSVNGFAIDMYHSTQLDLGIIGDKNEALRDDVAGSVRLFFDYIGLTELPTKHFAVKTYYFLSLGAPLLREVDSRGGETGLFVPSAAATNEQLIENLLAEAEWNQLGGKTTTDIDDDTFIRR